MSYKSSIVNTAQELKATTQFSLAENGKLICTTVAVFLFGLGFFCAHNVTRLNTSYSIKQFLPASNPLLKREAGVQKKFNLIEAPAFLVALTLPKTEKSGWLATRNLNQLEALTQSLENIKLVKKVTSLSNVQAAGEDPNSLSVGPLVKTTPARQLERRVLGDALLTPSLISKDARTALIMVDIGFLSLDKATSIEKEIQSITKKLLPRLKVEVGGVPAIQNNVGLLLVKELKNFVALAFIASLVVLGSIFATWSGIVVVLFTMALANVVTLGGMALFGFSFSVLSTTIPILVSITVLAISCHTLLRIDEETPSASNNGVSSFVIVVQVLKKLFMPNLLAALTTCVGFLTLASVPVPLIKQYGVSTAICVMAAWLVTNLALLAFLPLIPPSRARVWTSRGARWALFLIQRRKTVIVSVCTLCGFAIWQGQTLNWSPLLFNDLPENHPTRTATYNIDKNLGGTLALDLVIDSSRLNAWNDPISLLKLDRITRGFRAKYGIGSAVSVGDFIRSAHFKSGLSHLTRKGVAETLFLYSLSPENPLRNYLTGDGKTTRIAIRTHDVPARELVALIQSMVSEAKIAFPKDVVHASGMALSAPLLNEDLSRNLIFGFWQALAIIAIVLALVFRSLKWSLVACVPNLIPPLALLGALGVSHMPIKPGLAIVFSIALGLSFNNTVYLLERLRYQTRRGLSPKGISRAFYFESNPCVVSTLVIIAGFVVFLGSYFSLNRYFGVFMLISIFGGLLGDLVFLPALLVTFPALLGRKRNLDGEPHNLAEFPAIAKVAAGLAGIMIATSAHAATTLTPNGTEILKRAQRQIASKSETASVKLRIIEPDGSKRDRDLTIKRKSGQKNFVLATLQGPADLRGTAFLSVNGGGKEDQWLYLPSSKQTRRIIGGNRQSGFLGSEITYEDLSATSAEGAQVKDVKDQVINGQKYSVIETRAQKGKSSYSLVRSWISQTNYLALKADYYDWSNHLVKQITFRNYKRFGTVWRAQMIAVKNLKNKRESQLLLSGLSINKDLSDSEFAVQALEVD